MAGTQYMRLAAPAEVFPDAQCGWGTIVNSGCYTLVMNLSPVNNKESLAGIFFLGIDTFDQAHPYTNL